MHIHFCRKHNCRCKILVNNTEIEIVENLKILGLIFSSTYHWNAHVEYLKTTIAAKLNVIKCLSATRYNCSTQTLIYASKALIVSKISYGLQFYGYAPKSILQKLNSILNTTARIVLGGYRTTNGNNLLCEIGFLPINEQRDLLCSNLFKSSLTCSDTQLKKIINALTTHKNKNPKHPCTLLKSIKLCSNMDIPFKPPQSHQ